ncbi:TPA: hypothetical protein QB297_002200 [Pasteurella multocida]|nr:hypothetical protein [Pasteurella multocida]
MRLCRRSRFIRLAFLLPLFLISNFSYSKELWSSVGYWYYKRDLNNDNAITQSDCNLSKFSGAKKTDGNPNAPRVDIRTKIDSTGIVTDYGDGEKPFLGDGIFRYAEKIEFSKQLSQSQNSVSKSALETALRNNNCDVADSLLNAMTNPSFNQDGILSIEGDGYLCGITTSGDSDCLVQGPSQTCDDNGENCHITIGNDKRISLDELSKTKPKEKENSQNNSGSNGSSNSGGSGGNSSSSGSGNSNGSSSSGGSTQSQNQGGQGNNNSGGSGLGSGDGQGDGDGDGNSKLPELEEFDIRKSLEGLKSKLANLVKGQCTVSGDCPTISFSLFNATHTIDIHCKIISENGEGIRAGFSFLWTTIGVLIILSA